ncbi:hypothetical protein [Roseospira navarrensis]|uniref:Uncharacterized protein n=1 Tax=Roseospira navarrensis TaxID=140058 RepID=A0A7X1ZDG7_9PROT|nr:hypothetical protein [Roseospira navarrensis]MQX36538.1 hypothetical protein [Roseospira navarrensis]
MWRPHPAAREQGRPTMRSFDYFGTYLDTTRQLTEQKRGRRAAGARKAPGGNAVNDFLESMARTLGEGGVRPTPEVAPGNAAEAQAAPPPPPTPPLPGPAQAAGARPTDLVLAALAEGHADAAALVQATGLDVDTLLPTLKDQVFLGTVQPLTDEDGTRRFRLTDTGARIVAAHAGD